MEFVLVFFPTFGPIFFPTSNFHFLKSAFSENGILLFCPDTKAYHHKTQCVVIKHMTMMAARTQVRPLVNRLRMSMQCASGVHRDLTLNTWCVNATSTGIELGPWGGGCGEGKTDRQTDRCTDSTVST
jgi:hypothetical protein